MERFQLIDLTERDRWNTALEGISHDFCHSWDYCHSLACTTGLTTRLIRFASESVQLVCPVLEREHNGNIDVATPPGFSGICGSGPFHAIREILQQFARSRGYVCGYFSIHPLLEQMSFSSSERIQVYNQVYVLDLRKSENELVLGMDRNRRRELRNFHQQTSCLVTERSKLAEFIVSEYPRFVDACGMSSSYYRSAETLRRLCEARGALLLGTGSAQTVESAYLIGHTRSTGTCLIYVASPAARQHAAGLLWACVRQLRQIGVPWLNLGGGVAGNDSIAESKRRFGALHRPLRCIKEIFSPQVYEELCARAAVRPDAGTSFPPYRAAAR